MNSLVPILIFVFILSLVIFIHELGHFLAARKVGIFVEEFALGMGPKLIQLKGKKRSKYVHPDDTEGEVTLYTLRLFPIGGYCKMRDDNEDIKDDPEAMNNKSIKARILVVTGGSIMNFLLAFLLFFLLVMMRGYNIMDVRSLDPEKPGYHAGLQVGDRITHINGSRVSLHEDFMFMMEMNGGQEMEMRVDRNGQSVNLQVTPQWLPDQERFVIGFTHGRMFGLIHSRPDDPNFDFRRVQVPGGMLTAAEMIVFHIRAPFRMLARAVNGETMPEGAGFVGPIGLGGQVVEVYEEVVEFGFLSLFLTMLLFTALINAALGVMNLLPIPALDGARLVFLIVEGIRRKPVPQEKEAMVHFVGIVCLLALAAFIAYRDIVRLL